MAERTVPDYNYIFVTRGKVVWVVDGEDIPLGPGDLVIVPPRIEHHAYALKRRMTLISIHVTATLPGGQDAFELLCPPRFQHVPSGSPLDGYLRGAEAEYRRPVVEAAHMQQFWAQLVTHELFRSNARLGLLRYRSADPLIVGMLEDLERRIAEPVTLEALARRSGFSAQHLNRTFRRVLGVTPLKYLAGLRLQRATELLRDGKLTIAAIGQRVGFEDPYYFSRQFSAHFDMSPSEYSLRASSESPSRRSAAPFPKFSPPRK